MKDFRLDNEVKISSGFATPDNYFETFPEKIFKQLPKHEPKVISMSANRKTWYFAAAALLVLMLSIPVYNQYAVSSNSIDSATLENYIAYQSNISEDEIVDLLEPEDLKQMKLELNVNDKEIEEALQSNTNLEEYIID